MPSLDDTIVAVATARGEAAIAAIRISGRGARAILARLAPTCRALGQPRRLCRSVLRDPESGAVIDDGLSVFFPGPRSFTGEDVVELHGHGGTLSTERLLAACLAAGCRTARPGEFSYRAVCHGRLDLTQAEAVAALIAARSERAARIALDQLAGRLGAILGPAAATLTAAAASIEAGLDHPDEDLPPLVTAELVRSLGAIASQLAALLSGSAFAGRLREGAVVAVVGPPNAGKSSLVNALVEDDRAIVDQEPGTTRDVVEARLVIDGLPLTLLDTAGLRDGAGRVEALGIERSARAAARADLLLLVLDGSSDHALPPLLVDLVRDAADRVIAVRNKLDLPAFSPRTLPPTLAALPAVDISARTGCGLDALKALIGARLGTATSDDEALLTSARQREVVSTAHGHIAAAIRLVEEAAPLELVAAELALAREALAELFGRDAEEELLDTVFSTFCLGK